MAGTRLYLPSSGAAAVTPASLSASWGHNNAVYRPANNVKGASALTDLVYTPDAADHIVDTAACIATFVSGPLAAQTIGAQTLTLVARMLESNAGNNLFLTWHVFLISATGVVGLDLVAFTRTAVLELATTSVNRFTTATSTSRTTSAGDRICVSIGGGGLPVATTGVQGHNLTVNFGENSASDCVADNTGTAANNPYLDFGTTVLVFQTPFTLAGTQAQSGSLTHGATHLLSGTQAQSGSLTHRAAQAFSGTQAQSGAIAASHTLPQTLSGTQAQSGSLARAAAHSLSGTQAQAGTLARRVAHLLSGTQAQSGALARRIAPLLSGTQAQSGTLLSRVAQGLTGTQAQSGSLTRAAARSLSGTQAQSGSLTAIQGGGTTTTPRALSGTQAQLGTATRQDTGRLSGTQAQGGTLSPIHAGHFTLSGTQAQSGSLAAAHAARLSLSGTQAQAGSLTRARGLLLGGAQAQRGSLASRTLGRAFSAMQAQVGAVIRHYHGPRTMRLVASDAAASTVVGTTGTEGVGTVVASDALTA